MASHAESAMNALRRIVRALRTTHAGKGRAKLSAAQLFVLRQVAAVPGLSLEELCLRTLTGASAASEVVSKLIGAGLVKRRNGADHRRAAYSLTASGKRAVMRAPTSVPERLVEAFHRLSSEEQWSLARTLESWVAAADLDAVPAAMFFEAGDSKSSATRGED
jgi:DNA-binding MarR family transcriptional regulator